MAIYPGARWRPLGANTEPRITPRVVCLHTIVGSRSSAYNWFKYGNGEGYRGTESHFGIGMDGTVDQWQDTDFQADANGPDGGFYVISIETGDDGTPEDTPWTPEQFERIAQVLAWCYEEHDIPLELIPDTRPGRRGVGYHRQGVDPWRVPGGDRWSTSFGKTCPGEARIAQVPAVIERARVLAGLDDDMPSADEVASAVWNYRVKHTLDVPARASTMLVEARQFGSSNAKILRGLAEATNNVDALAQAVVDRLPDGVIDARDVADELLRQIVTAGDTVMEE